MTETPLTTEPAQARTRSPVRTAGLALLAYVGFNLLMPLVPLPQHPLSRPVVITLVLLPTLTFMLLQLWLALNVVATRPRPMVSGLLAVICAVLGAGLYGLSLRYGTHHPPVWIEFGQGLAVTLGCTFLGILLSPIIREPNVLLPVALVAMPIDYLGAMTAIGFTKQMVERHPGIVKGVSVPVPRVGGAAHHAGLAPIAFIGPGDVLFIAFFFAVAVRLTMNVRGTFWWIYGLLTATMIYVLSPGSVNVGALVPMGIAVLLANFSYFKLKREEVFATLYATILVLALVTGFYFYAHSRFVNSDSQGAADAQPLTPDQNKDRRNPAPGRPAANR